MRRGPAEGDRGREGCHPEAAVVAADEKVRAAGEENRPAEQLEGEEGRVVGEHQRGGRAGHADPVDNAPVPALPHLLLRRREGREEVFQLHRKVRGRCFGTGNGEWIDSCERLGGAEHGEGEARVLRVYFE